MQTIGRLSYFQDGLGEPSFLINKLSSLVSRTHIPTAATVGENQVSMRSEVCKNMEFLGIKFDESKNNVRGEEAIISADDSKVKVVVIPTDEELMIATDTMNLL